MERATGPPRSCSCALARWVPPSRCQRPGLGRRRAVLVSDPNAAGSELLATSKALARRLVTARRPTWCSLATSSRGGGSLLWSAVAERLGQGADFPAAEVVLGEDSVRVTRQSESADDVIDVALPAVVGVSDSINQPRYASLRGKMGAKKKPLEVLSAGTWASPPTGRRRRVQDHGPRARPTATSGIEHAVRGSGHRRPGDRRFLGGQGAPIKPLVLLEHDAPCCRRVRSGCCPRPSPWATRSPPR